jgi:hypothetical protein
MRGSSASQAIRSIAVGTIKVDSFLIIVEETIA